MNRNQRFLVALSGSEQDAQLLEYARLLASLRLARELRFVHVASRQHAQRVGPRLMSEDALSLQVTQALEKNLGNVPPGLVTSCHVLEGERIDTLLEFATRSRSDVILLGHHRRHSGQRSLARRLAIMAPASVWLLPEGAPTTIRRVLAPVDFSEHSLDALDVAADIAAAAKLESCLALHVYFDRSTIRYPEHVAEEQHSEAEAFREFLEPLQTNQVRVETRLEEGSFPAKTILRVAAEEQADLLVMNTRGRSKAAAILLGSVTTQVMVETPIAILAVKHFGAAMGLFQLLKESHFWKQPPPKTN